MQQSSGSKNALKAPFVVVLVAFLIAVMTLSIISFVRMGSSSSYASDIIDNWQEGALMDIAVAEKCPENFQEAISYTWPGISQGCWCGNTTFFLKQAFRVRYDIYSSSCDLNKTLAGCQDIPSMDSYTLDKWGVINGRVMKICLQRSQDTWVRVATQSNTECSNTRMTRCGSQPDNIFCTNEKKCPISDFKIVKINSDSNRVSSCAYENGCLVLSNNGFQAKLINFQRGDIFDALPVSQFRINEYGMCKIKNEDYNTPERPEYTLLKNPKTTCEDGTNLWNMTDFMTEKEFFDLNGLTPIISSLQQYGYYTPDTYNYKWKLFSRNYIPWKVQCRDQMKALIKKEENLANMKSLQKAFMVISIISCVVMLILISVNNCCLKEKPNVQKLTIFGNYFFKLLQLIYQIIALSASSSNKKFFSSVISQECSTSAISEILALLENDIKVAHNNNIAGLVIIIAVLLFDSIYLFYQIMRQPSSLNYYPDQDKGKVELLASNKKR